MDLKKFKVKVARSGVLSEVKKRKHYEKPGVKRRNEIKEKKQRKWEITMEQLQ